MVENNGPGDREGAKPPVRPAGSGDGPPAWASGFVSSPRSGDDASGPSTDEFALDAPADSSGDDGRALRAVPAPEPSGRPAWGDVAGTRPSGEEDSGVADGPAPWPTKEKPSAGRSARLSSTGRRKLLVGAGVGVVAVIFVGVFAAIISQFTGGSDEAPESSDEQLAVALEDELESSAPSEAESAAPAAGFSCDESREGKTVTGAGEGDTESVAGAVLKFERAYYVERDAEKVADVTAKDSPFREEAAVKTLQEGIDSVPSDTKYCVTVTPDGDKAKVELTEARPDQTPETFVQTFTTTRDGDRVLVTDVEEQE